MGERVQEEISYRRVPFELVEKFKSRASKERVTMANPDNAVWFAALHNDEVVGFSCLTVDLKRKTARFKSSFVLQEFRGKGIFSVLQKMRLQFCLHLGIKKITAYATPLSLPQHLKDGFQVKSYKGNIAYIVREL